MTLSIYSRLLQAEELLLSADDELLMQDFQLYWNSLSKDIERATDINRISPDDRALANIVTLRIKAISETFEQFSYACDDITHSFKQDVESIVEKHSQSQSGKDVSHPNTTTAPYIKSAYTWLLNNLFNPYPSKETREKIARQTGSDPKHVESWFGDVRKRMGWNALRKRHFSNKRRLTVTAATAFFHNQPSDLLTDAVRQDFATMSADAEQLYASKFTETGFPCVVDSFPHTPRSPGDSTSLIRQDSAHASRFSSFSPRGSSTCRPVLDTQASLQRSDNRKRCRSPEPTADISVRCTKRTRYDGMMHSPQITPLCANPSPGESSHFTQQSTATPSTSLPSLSECHPASDPVTPEAHGASCLSWLTSPQNKPQHTSLVVPSSSTSADFHQPDNILSIECTSNMLGSVQPPSASNSFLNVDCASPPVVRAQSELPEFSFDLPDSATCDQPEAKQPIDLLLHGLLGELFPGTVTSNNLVGNTSENTGFVMDDSTPAWNTLLDDPVSDDHPFGFFNSVLPDAVHSSADLTATLSSPPIDFDLNNFLSLDVGAQPHQPDSELDNLFLMNSNTQALSFPIFAPDSTTTKLIPVDQLRKLYYDLGQYIITLESQDVTAVAV